MKLDSTLLSLYRNVTDFLTGRGRAYHGLSYHDGLVFEICLGTPRTLFSVNPNMHILSLAFLLSLFL